MTTTPTDPTTDDLTDWIARTLSTAGAYCGGCDFEDGIDGCAECRATLYGYARALLTSGPLADRLNDHGPGRCVPVITEPGEQPRMCGWNWLNDDGTRLVCLLPPHKPSDVEHQTIDIPLRGDR